MAGFIVYMLLLCKKLNSSLLPQMGPLPVVWILPVLLSPGPGKTKKEKVVVMTTTTLMLLNGLQDSGM